MSGNRVDNRDNRDRYRGRKEGGGRGGGGGGDDERRNRNRGRQDDRYRGDKRERSPRRRERTRSRSPKYNKNYNNDNRHEQQQHQQYNRNDNNERKYRNNNNDNHSRKFNFNDKNQKHEKSPVWGKKNIKEDNEKNDKEKDAPNFGLSGKLTEDTNTVNGVVIKYSEPQDSRKPKRRWRLYPFKGEKALPTLYVHRQSAFLMGRDRKIADIPLDHPSCSKQHAALQYRLVPFKRDNGGDGKRVRPYIIDLESANGTFVNNVKLEPRRYHELLEKDVIKFGFSSREYVLLHEHSKDDELDDDVIATSETATEIQEAT
ncbi:hypothetical protein HCN44_008546 [Aphidius gifuensis]|uniref:FHA domain-containing protein n=1 Tax=Aphidius gifuensis TaxID=684658 RepID=A0A834XQM1_APHGI|nr:smad nuclear-interacting protein 1 [Aphidius gifuensis]KAF7989872.1 hypothetical protein HCN44_008546 [Aphidius gifuensis]